MAAVAAGPVFQLLGKKDLGSSEFPEVEKALTDGELAFRQHREATRPARTGRRSWRSPTALSSDHPPRPRAGRDLLHCQAAIGPGGHVVNLMTPNDRTRKQTGCCSQDGSLLH